MLEPRVVRSVCHADPASGFRVSTVVVLQGVPFCPSLRGLACPTHAARVLCSQLPVCTSCDVKGFPLPSAGRAPFLVGASCASQEAVLCVAVSAHTGTRRSPKCG